MKRILIVFETFHYSYDVVNFAIDLAKKDGSHLTMIFLKPLHADEAADYPFPNDLSLSDEEKEGKEQEDMKLVRADVRIFRDQCTAAGISYKVVADREYSMEYVIDQSAFADLILAFASPDMGRYSMKDLLSETHCPVLLIPNGFSGAQNIILSYDGTSSSTLAIKLFSYLFPYLKEQSAWLVNINGENTADLQSINDWLAIHYPGATLYKRSGDARKELVDFIGSLGGNTIVVMGAFGRKGFSRFLHKSMSYTILENTKAAIFIIHE